MHTICPGCYTRISDKAQYCHHCGDSIHPVDEQDAMSDKACPACSTAAEPVYLKSRSLTEYDFNFLECNRCAGMWLQHEIFKKLQVKNKKKEVIITGPKSGPSINEGQSSSFKYRKYPDCSELMLRKQIVPRTGVILDVCGIHGLWFDHQELEGLLRALRERRLQRVGTGVSVVPQSNSKKKGRGKRLGGGKGQRKAVKEIGMLDVNGIIEDFFKL